jgi:hypothetical protein
MKGSSTQQPDTIVPHNGGYQVRFNIEQVEKIVDGETVQGYEYDYVNVPDINKGTLIDALITERYDYPSQLGKLALDRTSQEWLDYQAFRESCYTMVDTALYHYTG